MRATHFMVGPQTTRLVCNRCACTIREGQRATVMIDGSQAVYLHSENPCPEQAASFPARGERHIQGSR